MYYYIIDPGKLPLEKFERIHVELQGLLTEFNVSGETAKVTTLRPISELVDTAANRGVKTIIACGNDDTFNLMLASLKGRDFTLGFIPFEENSFLGKILGIESLTSAVKTIAARRIQTIDMAKFGKSYFISYMEFGVLSQNLKNSNWWNAMKILSSKGTNISVRIDDSYNIEIKALGGMIVNARASSSKNISLANPTDGFLDLLILEQMGKIDIFKHKNSIINCQLEEVPRTSIIKCRKVEFMQPRGLALTMSGKVMAKFPCSVEMTGQKTRLIVGRNRTF